MKIAISAPNYHPGSGGIKALHYLGYLLTEMGHEVNMECSHLNPAWGEYSVSIPNYDFKVIPEINPRSHESEGNIVRWVLYFPGVLCGGPKNYPPHEMVVAYHPKYISSSLAASGNGETFYFLLPYAEMPGLNDPVDRVLEGVVWTGKGSEPQSSMTKDMIHITRDYPATREEMVRLLKSSKRLYSYDKYSSINNEALLCGCECLIYNYAAGDFENYYSMELMLCSADKKRDIGLVKEFLKDVCRFFGINP